VFNSFTKVARGRLIPVFSRMSRTIIPRTLPQNDRSTADPEPYGPELLNALSDAQRQSPEIKEFSRRMHDSGAKRVTWLFWHYQKRDLWTPLYALSHNGSMFSSIAAGTPPSRQRTYTRRIVNTPSAGSKASRLAVSA
jgi:hypothetical protein